MSKKDKLLKRLRSNPADFTVKEAQTVVKALGGAVDNAGKTSGSAIVFEYRGRELSLHRPHPGNTFKEYAVKKLIELLKGAK